MDDIGNLVYILVFIIWFLYRAFGKAGKKPTRPLPPIDQSATPTKSTEEGSLRPKPGEATNRPMTFEEMLRELTGVPQEKEAAEPEFYEDLPEYHATEDLQQEEEASFEVLETPSPVSRLSSVQEGKFKEFEIQRKKTSKAARAALRMLRSKQGARQAFIMKEIFDRRY